MNIQELPKEINQLLEDLNAPSGLRKHLQIVYSTAVKIMESVQKEWPELQLNETLLLHGAALHDIGKAEHPEELSEPGNRHVKAGYQLLLERGYSKKVVRAVLVHEDWNNPDRSLEELLISLSDIIWNGIRNNELEEFTIKRIAERTQTDFWDVYMKMDAILSEIAEGADERLAYQGGS